MRPQNYKKVETISMYLSGFLAQLPHLLIFVPKLASQIPLPAEQFQRKHRAKSLNALVVDVHATHFIEIAGGLRLLIQSEVAKGKHVFTVNLILAVKTVFPDEQIGQRNSEIVHGLRIDLQNAPFCIAKRTILECKTHRFRIFTCYALPTELCAICREKLKRCNTQTVMITKKTKDAPMILGASL